MTNNVLNFLGDYDTLVSIGRKVKRLLVVDFFGSWCGPCKALGAQIPQIAKENPDVIFLKCDIDDNKELAARFGVQSVPHIKFLKFEDETLKDLGTINGCDPQGIKAKIAQLK